MKFKKPKPLKPESGLRVDAIRWVSRIDASLPDEVVARDMFLVWKAAYLSNAAILARVRDRYYEISAGFLSEADRAHAEENYQRLLAARGPEMVNCLEPCPDTDGKGWLPFASVLPDSLSNLLTAYLEKDADMEESTLRLLAERMDKQGPDDGTFLLPDLSPEEYKKATAGRRKKPH